MKNVIGIIILLIVTSPAYASEDYIVRAKIYDRENLVGSPAMRVAPNTEAGVAVSGSYDLKLSIKPASESTANVDTTLVIGNDHLSPSMLVELDKESTVNISGKSISVLVSKVSS